MARFYVTGGRQRNDALNVEEWFSYGAASIYAFDDESGEVTHCLDYQSPPEVRPAEDQANVVFKAGSIDGKNLLVCTQTEILEYSLPDCRLVKHLSHPWLNDAHHVMRRRNGNLLVANTGLDMVLELDPEGNAVADFTAIPEEDPWDRFDKSVDYRKVVTTKPHHCHPNYVFLYKDEMWISRFDQRDLLCLSDPSKRIDIGTEKTHDGNLLGNLVYCTTVNGWLFVSDLDTRQVVHRIDLNQITGSDKALGWCRGLHILDEKRVLVGFSRLRPSKIRENLRWVKFKMGMREKSGGLPTRVDCFNIETRKLEWTVDLEAKGMNAVFSILPG
ncbi:hypothetical protein CSB20_11565 [bacterium DOLZORAL124_64_63]|nr:MAG: hypothetical protein CSB20_11565 [bacterium DOLZORAL124_64_63]